MKESYPFHGNDKLRFCNPNGWWCHQNIRITFRWDSSGDHSNEALGFRVQLYLNMVELMPNLRNCSLAVYYFMGTYSMPSFVRVGATVQSIDLMHPNQNPTMPVILYLTPYSWNLLSILHLTSNCWIFCVNKWQVRARPGLFFITVSNMQCIHNVVHWPLPCYPFGLYSCKMSILVVPGNIILYHSCPYCCCRWTTRPWN